MLTDRENLALVLKNLTPSEARVLRVVCAAARSAFDQLVPSLSVRNEQDVPALRGILLRGCRPEEVLLGSEVQSTQVENACLRMLRPFAEVSTPGPLPIVKLSLPAACLCEGTAQAIAGAFPGLTRLVLTRLEDASTGSAAGLSLLIGTSSTGSALLPSLQELALKPSPEAVKAGQTTSVPQELCEGPLHGATQLRKLVTTFHVADPASVQVLASLTRLSSLQVGACTEALLPQLLTPLTALTALDLGTTHGPLPLPALVALPALMDIEAGSSTLDASALQGLSRLTRLHVWALEAPAPASAGASSAPAANAAWQLPPRLAVLLLGSQVPEVLCGLRTSPVMRLQECHVTFVLKAGLHVSRADGCLLPAAEDALCGAAEFLTGRLDPNTSQVGVAVPLKPVGGEAGPGRRNHARWLRALGGTGMGLLTLRGIALSHQDVATIAETCGSLKELRLGCYGRLPMGAFPQLARLPHLERLELDVSGWTRLVRPFVDASALAPLPTSQLHMESAALGEPTARAIAAAFPQLSHLVLASADRADSDTCAGLSLLLGKSGGPGSRAAPRQALLPTLRQLTLRKSLEATADAPLPRPLLALLAGSGQQLTELGLELSLSTAEEAQRLAALSALQELQLCARSPAVLAPLLQPLTALTCLTLSTTAGPLPLPVLAALPQLEDLDAKHATLCASQLHTLAQLRSLKAQALMRPERAHGAAASFELSPRLECLSLGQQPPAGLACLRRRGPARGHLNNFAVHLAIREGEESRVEDGGGNQLLPAAEDDLCAAAQLLGSFSAGRRTASYVMLSVDVVRPLLPVEGEAGPGRRNHCRWLRALAGAGVRELALCGVALSHADVRAIAESFGALEELAFRSGCAYPCAALPQLARLPALRSIDLEPSGPRTPGPGHPPPTELAREKLWGWGAVLSLLADPRFTGTVQLVRGGRVRFPSYVRVGDAVREMREELWAMGLDPGRLVWEGEGAEEEEEGEGERGVVAAGAGQGDAGWEAGEEDEEAGSEGGLEEADWEEEQDAEEEGEAGEQDEVEELGEEAWEVGVEQWEEDGEAGAGAGEGDEEGVEGHEEEEPWHEEDDAGAGEHEEGEEEEEHDHEGERGEVEEQVEAEGWEEEPDLLGHGVMEAEEWQHEEGQEEGPELGHEEGHEGGQEEWLEEDREHGHEEWHDEGHEEGHNEWHEEGHEEDWMEQHREEEEEGEGAAGEGEERGEEEQVDVEGGWDEEDAWGEAEAAMEGEEAEEDGWD
ncbi:hypothetical protein HYH03_008070 [Edaphochlamys debaryana]|uniref:Uncharacterized protein n=1 Tax=Edaphochlamys debaryana TaxID=47281 RepID=A0A836BZX5_9CHLO|nr:hypothetical protein HYH03_008070 [Edaphochlamys debaryana]|eukprot:KAG2493854.1 hypothetical protein HYH03_008070 [Edaphochlamys debaryana]